MATTRELKGERIGVREMRSRGRRQCCMRTGRREKRERAIAVVEGRMSWEGMMSSSGVQVVGWGD